MVQKIIQYPTPLSVEYATDVRTFDEKLFSLIDDLKDTINENNLDGLAAYQIGNYFNVIVIKDDDIFLEIINPRLIGHSGSVTTEETTNYYPNRSAQIQRFETISIVYQDRNGLDKTLKASNTLAILLQRKIDYTFGATFIHKMAKDEKHRFENNLGSSSKIAQRNEDYCPQTFNRDKILLVSNFLIVCIFLILVASFLISEHSTLAILWNTQLIASSSVVLLDVIYFFYAQYEGKKYVSCDSCQLGNMIGTVTVSLFRLSIVIGLSYYFIGRI
ncbi:peptide deformylase [Sulfurimonas sp.]